MIPIDFAIVGIVIVGGAFFMLRKRREEYGNFHFSLIIFSVLIGYSFFAILYDDNLSTYINKIAQKKENIIIALGWIMGGVLAMINAAILNKRAIAQNDILKEQIKANQLTEKGHNQDRFKAATEHLGSEKSSVRIASFRAFYHLARDGNEELRKDVFEILCDHLRNTARDENYPEREPLPTKGGKIYGSTTEVQTLLDILFKPNDKNEYIFENFPANLRGVCLDSVDFYNAILEEADFSGATLSNVSFVNANLTNANLSHISILSGNGVINIFACTKFHGANFWSAKMQEVDFTGVEFQGAIFYNAKLQHAILTSAKMQGAFLNKTKLHGANLWGAKLHGANLSGADLSEEGISGAYLGNAAVLENTEFQGAILSANFGIKVHIPHRNSNKESILDKSVFFGEISENEANATISILDKCKHPFSKSRLKNYTDAVESNKGKDKTWGLYYSNPEHERLIKVIQRRSTKLKPDE